MNNLFVISGPSGSGKSTLIRQLLKEFPDLEFSVSHTTRPKRPGEKEGKDYHFISDDAFSRMVDQRKFVEWAQVYDHRYGTSRQEIESKSGEGHILVLDVDVQGGRSIKRAYPEAMMVLIVPPSLSSLSERIQQRERGINEAFEKRLLAARREIEAYAIYDFLVVNDDLEEAYLRLKSLLTAFRLAMPRNLGVIRQLMGETK